MLIPHTGDSVFPSSPPRNTHNVAVHCDTYMFLKQMKTTLANTVH